MLRAPEVVVVDTGAIRQEYGDAGLGPVVGFIRERAPVARICGPTDGRRRVADRRRGGDRRSTCCRRIWTRASTPWPSCAGRSEALSSGAKAPAARASSGPPRASGSRPEESARTTRESVLASGASPARLAVPAAAIDRGDPLDELARRPARIGGQDDLADPWAPEPIGQRLDQEAVTRLQRGAIERPSTFD